MKAPRATSGDCRRGRPFSADDLEALEELNRLRALPHCAELETLERRFASIFGADSRLAVYGSLAPGRSNHHHLASLSGHWLAGLTTRGDLLDQGWGRGLGFPALRWSASGPPVAVHLLVSPGLATHWRRLDLFEGPDYLRILVPLFAAERVVTVANLYAARTD